MLTKMSKYKLTKNKKEWCGITLFQIEATASFGSVVKGELGGYVEKEEGEVGEALYKICPECGEICAPAQMYCYKCSHCFINIKKK